MSTRVDLSGADVEALRLVRDLARETLEVAGFGRKTLGKIREVRRTWEGLTVLTRIIGESEAVLGPEARLLECVRFAEERGYSVEIDWAERSVNFRRNGAIAMRVPGILSHEEPVDGILAAMPTDPE